MRAPAAPAAMVGVQGMKWTTTLKPEAGSQVAGTASLEAGKEPGTSIATISITGGTPGATYPWHVHQGKCTAGPVFGSGAAYKPVKVGSDGTGKATANINAAPPNSGDFHVNVHASPTDMKTIVSCGELTMAGM